jgi:hypothetical protein
VTPCSETFIDVSEERVASIISIEEYAERAETGTDIGNRAPFLTEPVKKFVSLSGKGMSIAVFTDIYPGAD